MPTRLMRKALRERRRAVVVGVLVFSALHLAGLGAGALSLAVWLTACGAAIGAGWFAALAPGLRGVTETLALASLAFAGLARALPGSAIDFAGQRGEPLVALAVWFGLVALARSLRRGLIALPGPLLTRPRFKTRAGSRLDIYRLWYGLVPTPGQETRYGDPDLVAIEQMSLRLGRVRLVTHRAPAAPREAHLQILEVEAPFHVRLRACEQDPRGVMEATGVSEIFLVELGRRRLVLFSHEFPDMPLGRAVLAWLDDAPGRMLDRRLAAIERRARDEKAGGSGPDQWPDDAQEDAAWAPALRTAPRARSEADSWRQAS